MLLFRFHLMLTVLPELSHHSIFELFLAGKLQLLCFSVFLPQQMSSALFFYWQGHSTYHWWYRPEAQIQCREMAPILHTRWGFRLRNTPPNHSHVKRNTISVILLQWNSFLLVRKYMMNDQLIFILNFIYMWGSHQQSEDPRVSVFKARRNH